jgi:mannosyltransferase
MTRRLRRLAHPLLPSISLHCARRTLTRRGRWPPSADLAGLALLGLLLALVLVYAAALPQNTLVVAPDHPPPGVEFQGVYGVEGNAGGPFRWTKPQAAVLLPVTAPGTYRLTLRLQEGVAGPAPRPVAVIVNGTLAGTIVPEGSPHDYSFAIQLEPEHWARARVRVLAVEIQTAPVIPPSDPRPVGIMLLGVRLEPAGRGLALPAALLVPYLLILGYTYGFLRTLRLPSTWAVAVLLLPLAVLATAALVARAGTLALAYTPLWHPFWFGEFACFLALVAVQRWCWPRAGTVPAPAGDGALWSRHSLPLVPVVVLAGAVRLAGYNRLSLWLDEGFTVIYARLPWPALLGFRGPYDVHPPLYYALVKLVTSVVAERDAGRLVSVVAGTATVIVLYALALRLTDRATALWACLGLALSPLHVWYSQEGRMYALSVLLVGLSYLALVAVDREEPHPGAWALLYGLVVLLALYTDYSVWYPLAPQAVLLARILWRQRTRATVLACAALQSVVAFLPWVAQQAASVQAVATRQASFLAATPGQVTTSLVAIAGLAPQRDYYWATIGTPWARWPGLQPLLLVPVLLAAGFGLAALARRSPLALLVLAALTGGTICVAVLVSLRAPGYADRTVLYAVLGWVVLVGAAPSFGSRRLSRVLGPVTVSGLLILATVSLVVIDHDARKQDYRGFAEAISDAAGSGLPVMTDGVITDMFVNLYAPAVPTEAFLAPVDGDVAQPLASDGSPPAFWFAYADYPWTEVPAWRQELAALGYERVQSAYARHSLIVERYARP